VTRRGFVAAALAASVILASGSIGFVEDRLPGFLRKLKASGLGAADLTAPDVVRVDIDVGADAHAISPYIYGIAKREDPAAVAELGATLNRWGGNPSSRYNWVIGHAWNTGADYQYRNTNYGARSGSESDRYVAGNQSRGLSSLITIPGLGWVARSDSSEDRSLNLPDDGGPGIAPDGRIKGYDPNPNRKRTSVPSHSRKPAAFVSDPDPGSSTVYQDEWVNHLVTRFGPADAGGVRFYAIDNEPDLWSQTHRDVHPARVGYNELARVFLDYASAVKQVDPSAMILGPESSGWTAYWYSELDRGVDKFATHADRRAHGDLPLIPWFLRTVRQHDLKAGARSLDVLTVHFYPQARRVYSDDSDPGTDRLRLRSTRALWDPTYTDESWIRQPVRLIPLLKAWVAAEYPGTRIGLTEYNFGGGDSISAALAQAEVLGILGREDVYMASYWRDPPQDSPTWFAFRLYRNCQGGGPCFGDTSVSARSTAFRTVSAYASRQPGWVDVILINKDLAGGKRITLSTHNAQLGSAAQRFEYSSSNLAAISRKPDLSLAASGAIDLNVPPASITLLKLPLSP
jgi:hypothetical protein